MCPRSSRVKVTFYEPAINIKSCSFPAETLRRAIPCAIPCALVACTVSIEAETVVASLAIDNAHREQDEKEYKCEIKMLIQLRVM